MAIIKETPGKSLRLCARIGLALTHGKRCLRGIPICDGIGQGPDEAVVGRFLDVGIAEQAGCFGDELLTHHAGQWTIRTGGDREPCNETIGARRDIALPCAPDDGEAVTHQEPVAGRLRMAPLGGTIKSRQHRLIAPIGHIVQQPAIAAIQINRLQNAEFDLILHATPRIAWRLVEIDDVGVQVMRGIQFAKRGAMQSLIGSDAVELRTAEYRCFTLGDFDPTYATAIAHVVLRTRRGNSTSTRWCCHGLF